MKGGIMIKKKFLINYYTEIKKHNELVKQYNETLQLCIDKLREIVALAYCDAFNNKVLKLEKESEYISYRDNLKSINDKIYKAFSSINNLENDIGNKKIKRLKKNYNSLALLKKVSVLDVKHYLSHITNLLEIEDANDFKINKTTDVAINKDWIHQIGVEFKLSFYPGFSRIYKSQDNDFENPELQEIEPEDVQDENTKKPKRHAGCFGL